MIILIFTLGTSIGSFITLLVNRIPREENIVKPSSHCDHCKGKIKFYDLIPLVSYILLKGKCRYCKSEIGVSSFLIELFTGILFTYTYLRFSFGFLFIKSVVFMFFLLVISIIDLKTQNIYTSLSIASILCGIVFSIFYSQDIYYYILGALIGGGIIFLIVHLTHGMGEGDIELCTFCGLFLGVKGILVCLVLSFTIGGIVSIIVVLTKSKSLKSYIPFGPFVCVSGIITLFFLKYILDMYLHIIS